MKDKGLLTRQWHVLHKKPCAFQDLKTHLQSCRNLKRLEMKLIKCYQTTKKEKAQKKKQYLFCFFFLLNRHSNFIKNSFCHSLTGIPHFRAITSNQRHMHSMFLHCYKHNIQPTYFKVQLFIVLESVLSLCYDSMFQVISQNGLSPSQGDCNKAVNDFIIHLALCTLTLKHKVK